MLCYQNIFVPLKFMQIFADEQGIFACSFNFLSLAATIRMYFRNLVCRSSLQQFECSIVIKISTWGKIHARRLDS